MQRDCHTAAVRTLQELLIVAGFGAIAPDGIFGPQTEAALIAFESTCAVCAADGRIELDGVEWVELQSREPEIDYATELGDLPDASVFGFGYDVERPSEPVELVLGFEYDICFFGFDQLVEIDSVEIDLVVDGPASTRTVTFDPSEPATDGVEVLFAANGPTRVFIGNSLTLPLTRLDDSSHPGSYRSPAIGCR